MIQLLSFFFVFSLTAHAQDNAAIKTDLKFLCEINKMEKSLSKDQTIETADLAARVSALKKNAFSDPATKEALEAISTMTVTERPMAWKKFAKDNKVTLSCL